MGAVFALYSAWYFWIPKILGINYNKSGGKIQFWILFVGVNVTFFPQHFLGLQGMPRRISDYPDAFAGWNLISSFGSILSVVATWLFLYILYAQLVQGKHTSKYPLLSSEFITDILQIYLLRAFDFIEWCLNSPPKPHPYISLPVQSGIEILFEDEISEALSDLINFLTNSTNQTDFITEWFSDLSIDRYSAFLDDDIKSSTINDLEYSSVNDELLDLQSNQTDKTYYIDNILGWLDQEFSFLKQDFGKMFPKSVYAMQDLSALQPHNSDLTVMMNNNATVNNPNVEPVMTEVEREQYRTWRITATNSFNEVRDWIISIYNVFITAWPNIDINLTGYTDTNRGERPVLTNLTQGQILDLLSTYTENLVESMNRYNEARQIPSNLERYPLPQQYLDILNAQSPLINIETDSLVDTIMFTDVIVKDADAGDLAVTLLIMKILGNLSDTGASVWR